MQGRSFLQGAIQLSLQLSSGRDGFIFDSMRRLLDYVSRNLFHRELALYRKYSNSNNSVFLLEMVKYDKRDIGTLKF